MLANNCSSIDNTRSARSVVSKDCVTTPEPAELPVGRSGASAPTFRVDKVSCGVALMRATYRLTAWLRACGRSNSTTAVRRTCGVLSRSRRWLRTQQPQPGKWQRRGRRACNLRWHHDRHVVVQLATGGRRPTVGCLGGCLVERVRFSLPPSQCASLLNTSWPLRLDHKPLSALLSHRLGCSRSMERLRERASGGGIPRSPSIAAQTPPSIPITPTSSQVLAQGSRSPASARLKAKHGSPGGSPPSNRRSEAIGSPLGKHGGQLVSHQRGRRLRALVQHEGALAPARDLLGWRRRA